MSCPRCWKTMIRCHEVEQSQRRFSPGKLHMRNCCLTVFAAVSFVVVSAPLCPAGKPSRTFREEHNPGGVTGLAYTPDGKRLVSVGHGSDLLILDVPSGKQHARRFAAGHRLAL